MLVEEMPASGVGWHTLAGCSTLASASSTWKAPWPPLSTPARRRPPQIALIVMVLSMWCTFETPSTAKRMAERHKHFISSLPEHAMSKVVHRVSSQGGGPGRTYALRIQMASMPKRCRLFIADCSQASKQLCSLPQTERVTESRCDVCSRSTQHAGGY